MAGLKPYEPPVAAVPPGFIAGARRVDAARGWTWIVEGFKFFLQAPGLWMLAVLIFFGCVILIGVVPLLGGIANMVLYPVFMAGFVTICRTLDAGEPMEIGQLFAGFRNNRTGDLVVCGAIAAAVMVGLLLPALLIVGGAGVFAALKGDAAAVAALGVTIVLVVLVMAAISVPVYMALWFAAPLAGDHGLKPVDALKASLFACLKNVGAFLIYGLVALVLALFATLPVGLGWLVLGPVLLASVYVAYRDLFFEP